MTLVELLVVLAILAVLTTLAITLTDGLVEQTRFETTQRTLENLQSAVLGPTNQLDSDGSRGMSGFLADVGRPPLLIGNDPSTQLAELWSNPNGLLTYGPRQATSDAQVVLLAGWRGPYLRLPTQPIPQLLDGWGNSLALTADANSQLISAQSVGGPSPPYNVTVGTTTPFAPIFWTINGSVVDSDPTTPEVNSVTVTLYYPDLTQANGINQSSVTATQANGYSFVFTNIPAASYPTQPVPAYVNAGLSPSIGPRALRAYHTYTDATSMKTVNLKSDILYLRVFPGGLTRNISIDIH